jgi:hypothetical protein
VRSHWVRGSPAPPAPLPRCGPCGGLHVCLGNTLGGTGLKPVPTNAVKDRAAGRPHPQPRSRAAGLAVASTSVSEIASRDGFETRPYQRDERQPSPASAVVNPTSRFETRPYQRDERQSCGSPAPPAPLPRCGPCGGLHVCLRNTLGGTGLKPVPTNAVKDRAAGRPHPQPRSRAAGLAVASTSVSEIASRDGFETRPYQRDERQPSPASAVVNPTSRFETRPYQRGERQSCGPPAPPAPLPRCGPCGGLHVCLRNTLGGTGLKPVPTNAVKDRAAGRPHPQPCSRAAGLAVASTSVSEIASRDGFETRPYQRDERQPSPAPAVVNPTSRFETRPYQRGERQSCGSPAPPAPLPRCGPCGGLHVCLRNTLVGTGLKPVPTNAMKDSRRPLLPSLTQPAGLKPVPTNAMKDSRRPLLPSLTQPAGLKPVPTNAVKDRAAGRPHPQPRSRAAGLAVTSTSVSEIH